jgi:sugar lactone lactonase YvrE
MTATEDGTRYIANPARHRVETYSPDGKFIGTWGEKSRDVSGFSGCGNPVGLAQLDDGRFVTAERGHPRVKVYDATGKFLGQLTGPAKFADNARVSGADQAQGCQSGGLDVAVDSKDRLLVLDRVTGDVHVIG